VLDSIVIDKIFTYVALENATLWVFQKADKLTLKLLQTMTFPDTTEINYGEFHTVPETKKLLFITESNMYLIGDMDISKIDGYRPSSQSFSGAVAINSRYLAIGFCEPWRDLLRNSKRSFCETSRWIRCCVFQQTVDPS
jgi:hypothetical protein